MDKARHKEPAFYRFAENWFCSLLGGKFGVYHAAAAQLRGVLGDLVIFSAVRFLFPDQSLKRLHTTSDERFICLFLLSKRGMEG